MFEVVSVTKKGQATIPKRFREKYGIKNKAIVEESECGLLLKPLPSVDEEFGSLEGLFEGKTARQLLEEARKEEFVHEKELEHRYRKIHV